MQLDLYRNELVFKRIENAKTFADALDRGQGLKYRKYGNAFYISLAHFAVARQVLREYSGQLRITAQYEHFAQLFVVNKNPIHIEWGPATCRISGAGMPWDLIIPATSYFDKAALQSEAYKNGQWEGRAHLFDPIKGKFPSGLLERILGMLRERDVPFTISRAFNYPPPQYDLHPVFDFEPTEDQIKAVAALAKANNGIAKLPTAFGKTSFVSADLIATKAVRSMFLANQRVLISDAKKDFVSVFRNDNIKIGTIGDGEFDPGDITVASIQGVVAALEPPSKDEVAQVASDLRRAEIELQQAADPESRKRWQKEANRLQGRIKKIQDRMERSLQLLPFLESIDLFIVDEAQVLGTNMWNKFLHACPAPYRYTLSATPTRGDGGAIQIIAATGEVRYESSAADQIAKGRLSEFKGYFGRFDHGIPQELSRELKIDYHQAYRIFIMNNRLRNEHLCDKVIEYAKGGASVLALVTLLDHAEIVKQTLLDKGMPEWIMHIVTGDTPKKQREDSINRYRAGEFPILIGSSIFDVGFNAKNASRMVRFNAGGSEVREPQRAGRTVRVREDGSHGETYDMLDLNVPFFQSQSFKRFKLLQEEFGHHRVKVLPITVTGDLDIVSLREVVAEIPDKTDRQKGEEIIARLQGIGVPDDAPEFEGLEEIENDPDLKAILEELRFDTI